MPASPAQLPFKEAIDFFQKKVQLPSSGWTDLWQEQHSHAFMVAGANSDALVEDFYNAVQDAKTKGTGYAEFRTRFDEIVTKHGWAHNGSPGWRSKVIHSTNVTQAYNAGRYQQMQAVKHLRPYAQYSHTPGEHPRLQHLAWNGMIFSMDDPILSVIWPQNGWGCNCKMHSLSRVEAGMEWEKSGKSGPDKLELEWEEKVVGKNGSNPRTVLTPKGIDPGFAYNPGKAWLEPHTVPPLTGYEAVLKERGTTWPTGFKPPALPTPTQIPASAILPAGTAPERAVSDFLDVFGASMEQGAVFEDATGSAVAITKALFQDGKGEFKWLASAGKIDRLQYINLLAMTLIEPDEVWWHWDQDRKENGRWRLKRRYLRAFEIEGSNEFGLAVFEWSRAGWTGATTFMASQKSAESRRAYVEKQRIGKLVFHK